MTKIVSTPLLLLLFFVSSQKSFSQCFQIESILVAACSPAANTEGYNEMVRFQVGPNSLNTSNLVVDWPSNGWEGLVQNSITASKVATLNADIDAVGGCGNLLEPIGGVLPANASVILVTSYLMDTDSNSFGALAEDTYIIFQNNTFNTAGHFANYNVNPGLRTLEITFTGAGGCTDTVTYDRTLLTGSIGDTVLFTPAGGASYDNFGCSAPIPPFTVDAGVPSTSPACAGTTISLLGTAEGQQSLLWTAPTGTLSDPTIIGTNYTIPGDAAGQSITITLTATNSCGASITDTLIVNVISSTVPTFNLPTTLCTGATAPTLPTTSLNGITGTWSPSAINNMADGSYFFTPNAGQCSSIFTLNITVSSGATPVLGFSYPTSICINSTSVFPILDPGFTAGGTFSSDSGLVIDPITGEVNPSASTPMPHSVVYTVVANPAACLAAGVDTALITFDAAIVPVVNFSYPTQVCINSTPVSPTTASGFTTGGTFTSDPGLAINPTTGEVDIASSTVGPHTITYTVLADPSICQGGNSSSEPLEITGNITPVTGFSYPSPVCVNSAPISPTPVAGFATGGIYTANDSGLVINSNTGEINVAASTPASYVVTYTITADPSICRDFGDDTFPVVIQSSITPEVGFTYPASICKSSTSVMPILAPGFTSGGIFTSDSGLSINPATGEINPSSSTAAPHSIIYTIAADPANCLLVGTDNALVTFVAETTPEVSFTYPAQVCTTSTSVFPTTSTGFTTGGTYSSDPGLVINSITGEVNIASSAVGLHTITYTVLADPSLCQGGDSFSVPLEITGSITPITGFSYNSPVCTSSAPIFPTPVAGFTTGGTYTVNNPGLVINPNTGEINVAASTPASYVVTYTVNADSSICRGFGDDVFSVVIQSLSAPVVNFSYTTPVCPNDPPENPILPAGFSMGGTFTSDAGLSINPTTGQINLVTSTPGLHVITYTVLQNDITCTAGDSDTFNFTIDATAAITPITGPTSLCVGETIQLSNATPGGTWSSSDESVATVDNNGLVTALFSNFVDIIYTLNNGCASETRTTITVYEIPQPVLQDRYLCISNVTGDPFNSVRIECGIPNQGYTFTWTLDGNPLPTTTNTHVATELGVYEVTVTNDVSGCSNTASCTVLPSSTAVATATVGEDFNQNQTITVDVTGGSGDYLFQLDYGVPQESNVFTFVHQGEYTITVIDQNGCQDLVLTVFAINYPRYFTPNGDGFNDFWKIEGITDLNSNTFIYDRFGKLVKAISTSGEGWDGTLNGEALPSTDYWFQLLYKNRDGINKEFKAHFSLKR